MQAAFRFNWPGQGWKRACEPHTRRAVAVAKAMGFLLSVERWTPIPPELRGEPVDERFGALELVEDEQTEPGNALNRAALALGEYCPGERHCFTRGGSLPCRLHGCRACGAPILADSEGWPAPLCIVHAPSDLIDYADGLRVTLEAVLARFDGFHDADCAMWTLLGRRESDFALSSRMESMARHNNARALCTCGLLAVREAVRQKFKLAHHADTMRPPAERSS